MSRNRQPCYRVPLVPAPVPKAGNEWYPLPPDYPLLDGDGQRQARVNAACLRGTPEEFVDSWDFFRRTYLEPTEPGFFYKRRVPSPPAHYQMIEDIGRYRRSIHVAPRGSAKSTIITRELNIKLALTLPHTTIFDVVSVHRLVGIHMTEVSKQFEENPFIIADFGNVRPSKGSRYQWSMKEGIFNLSNGATIECVSVDGRKRGARPDWIFLDDPEFDPAGEASETELSRNLESLIFRQLLPMLDVDQTFEWVGTLLNRRSALAKALFGRDPRFEHWNRRLYSAYSDDPTTGERSYFWPKKWDDAYLDNRRSELGEAAFEAEMQNNPRSDAAVLFHLEGAFNTYRIDGDAVSYGLPPDGGRRTLPLSDWFSGLAIAFLIDLAHRPSATSDYNCCLAAGWDGDDDWWVIDLLLNRKPHHMFLRDVEVLGARLRPCVVGVEDAAGQALFGGWLDSHTAAKGPGNWVPPWIFPIRYPPKLSKEARISALETRMSRSRIRLPEHNRRTWPISELWNQVEGFTSDGLSLSWDDAIDSLSMLSFVPRRRAGGGFIPPDNLRDILKLLELGETTDPYTGLPLLWAMDPAAVPSDILHKFMHKRHIVKEVSSDAGNPSALTTNRRGRTAAVLERLRRL